jgi:L-alanine-DL-glutamate epimerase-like enolase superfamily enzyme
MRYVRQRIPYPVMADESIRTPADVLRVAEREAADLVNLKLAKHGGLLRTREVAAVAEAVGLGCSLGSMMEAVDGVAASVALASTLPWSGAHDLDAARWLAGRRTAGEPVVEYRPPMVLARWPEPDEPVVLAQPGGAAASLPGEVMPRG